MFYKTIMPTTNIRHLEQTRLKILSLQYLLKKLPKDASTKCESIKRLYVQNVLEAEQTLVSKANRAHIVMELDLKPKKLDTLSHEELVPIAKAVAFS